MALNVPLPIPGRLSRIRAALLNLPLFKKILIANSALIALGTVLGYWLTRHFTQQSAAWWTVLVGISSIAVSVLLNSVILKAALSAIEPLRQTVEQVRRGNRSARASRPFFGDPDLGRLGDTLNALLDTTEAQRRELETQLRRVQALSGAVIRAQEEERQRIALELHDEASQALTAIIVGHRVIDQLDDLEKIKDKSRELRDLTADTLDALHRLIVELRPSLLEERGLIPALRWHAEEYAQRFGIKPELTTAGFDGRLTREVETTLFRIVQEALTNAARHASPHHVWIRLARTGGQIQASIEDDGMGFDPHRPTPAGGHPPGLGLVGMQERATLVGGRCEVRSASGHGTIIKVMIPDRSDTRGADNEGEEFRAKDPHLVGG